MPDTANINEGRFLHIKLHIEEGPWWYLVDYGKEKYVDGPVFDQSAESWVMQLDVAHEVLDNCRTQ